MTDQPPIPAPMSIAEIEHVLWAEDSKNNFPWPNGTELWLHGTLATLYVAGLEKDPAIGVKDETTPVLLAIRCNHARLKYAARLLAENDWRPAPVHLWVVAKDKRLVVTELKPA